MYFLRCSHCASKLDFLAGEIGDHLFQRSQHSDRVEIVVIADVRNAKKLAFHLSLAVGDDRSKLIAEMLADGRRVDGFRSGHRGQRGGGS